VALTGILLVLFVTGHLLGNFTFFFGPDAINAYAKNLHSLGPLLWLIRAGLLAVLVTHIAFTVLLWKENHAARPTRYTASNRLETTVFARTMRLSGLVVLAFVVFHLAHFTAQVINPEYKLMKANLNGEMVHDVYGMMVAGFGSVPIVAFYVIGLFLLTMHLNHGLGSLFQTLGITNQHVRPLLELSTKAYAWLLFVGYASIPLSVLVFGLGKNVAK